MNRYRSTAIQWLRWSLVIGLGLIAINLGLPALFLLLQIPSFAIENDVLWLLRWQSDSSGSHLQFNLLPLLTAAIALGLVIALRRDRQ